MPGSRRGRQADSGLHLVMGEVADSASGFEVAFLSAGQEARRPLSEARSIAFELVEPVRSFPSFKGQRNFPGLWWSATSGRHVGFESWLERDHAMLLDFDPDVVGFASQPFWLFWPGETRRRSHAPDWFARLRDGSAVVLDSRPAARIRERDAHAFEQTAAACRAVGWQYWLWHEPDPVRSANLRWLAGYRHPRHHIAEISEAVLEVFSIPAELMAGAGEIGDPIRVLPVVFHLRWKQVLVADLQFPLSETSVVAPGREYVGVGQS
ncbi:TnsA-like heteromeric transposase endonuclease subunit [Planomonospora algeriensis]